ncbi:hypothetical protein BSL82_15610 [Tardibacter chloracetimidivorans]|uniref:N-acetyltransferase domain-containing protein n=1 Tax=Tardibacter chloracetimidivorans TaxID=1921510 RepID=A0A1L3ZY25_9SPHN|nr:hypothetical protein BSL82_15610 [Tardibacter chloracetimidivorans]
MFIEPLSAPKVRHIVTHMREWDHREIFATSFSEDPDGMVESVMSTGAVSWVAGLKEPIATWGAAPCWPGVWSLWMFATDDFRQIGLSVTKFIRRTMIPTLWADGAHRLECRSMEGHVEAQRWLGALGAQRECTLKRYGKNGDDFHIYTWERP